MASAQLLEVGMPLERVSSSAPNFARFTLNQTTDLQVFVVQAPAAATITRLGIRVQTITGTTPTYRISAQGLSTAGAASGTIKGASNSALHTFSPSALGWAAGEWHWINLDESFDVTRGECFSIVIDYSSGTVDGSNNAAFTASLTGVPEVTFPYQIQINAGSSTRQNGPVVVGWGSVGTAYGRPLETLTLNTFVSTDTPDEYALKFTLPAGFTDTVKVAGIRLAYASAAGTSTHVFTLYDTDGTSVLQDYTHDSDFTQNAQTRMAYFYFDEATLTALTAGGSYYLALKPAGATSTSVFTLTFDSADDAVAWPGGTIFTQATRTDAGAWSADGTVRIQAALILDDMTEPASGANSAGVGAFMSSIVYPQVAPY